MKHSALRGVAGMCVLATLAGTAFAGPILKPRKYYGPIPPASLSLRIGFLGETTNGEMIRFLDGNRSATELAVSDDFGNGLAFDATYMYKPHPQFGLRINSSLALLESTGKGFFVDRPVGLPDSVPSPVFDYNRTFSTDLVTLDVSGVYFFTDAAVQDFQPYVGGGFSIGFPHEVFEEKRTNRDTGEITTINNSEWSAEAGVHGVIGAFYYVTNHTAIVAEGRAQLMQSNFPISTTNEFGQPENVSFVVDYTGFSLSLGVSRAF